MVSKPVRLASVASHWTTYTLLLNCTYSVLVYLLQCRLYRWLISVEIECSVKNHISDAYLKKRIAKIFTLTEIRCLKSQEIHLFSTLIYMSTRIQNPRFPRNLWIIQFCYEVQYLLYYRSSPKLLAILCNHLVHWTTK